MFVYTIGDVVGGIAVLLLIVFVIAIKILERLER